jgi:hypothetical protein
MRAATGLGCGVRGGIRRLLGGDTACAICARVNVTGLRLDTVAFILSPPLVEE